MERRITLKCVETCDDTTFSIRRAILDRGTKAILKYLKDKIPEQ